MSTLYQGHYIIYDYIIESYIIYIIEQANVHNIYNVPNTLNNT